MPHHQYSEQRLFGGPSMTSLVRLPRPLGIITARAGSKRLPGKHLLQLGDKPLIAWTIEAARRSGIFSKIILSTDSARIASVGSRYGAEVPFLRPAQLARDRSTHVSVVEHTLGYLKNEGINAEYFMLLQPTSPFRTAVDLRAAWKLMARDGTDAVVSVCPMIEHPYLARTLSHDGTLVKLINDRLTYRRSQALPEVYRPNGAIYLCRTAVFQKYKTFFPSKTRAYIMSRERSIDIDTRQDYDAARAYCARKRVSHA
jgi:CMP-N,N'-diacetyllegionaminic acid synthase